MRRSTTIRTLLLTALLIFSVCALASPAAAQDTPQPSDQPSQGSGERESPFQSFQTHREERVRPSALPDIGPLLPARSSRQSLQDLPRALTSRDLERVGRLVDAATVPLVAVHRPPRPYRQTEMVYRGFALWISAAPGEAPILVATGDWLQGAEAVYAVTNQAAAPGTIRDLEEATAGTNFVRRHRDHLAKLEILSHDTHVNLVHLGLDEPDRQRAEALQAPDQGLLLHDMEVAMPSSLFGLSGSFSSVTPLTYEDSRSLPEEFSFYFLTTSNATLGAPIVGPDGRLLGIAAIPYPPDPQFSLAIPPGAIHYFLRQVSGSDP